MKLKKQISRPLLVLALCAFTLALIGCNTVRGVGRDIEKAGEVVQRGAD